jgi:hypothetical protein
MCVSRSGCDAERSAGASFQQFADGTQTGWERMAGRYRKEHCAIDGGGVTWVEAGLTARLQDCKTAMGSTSSMQRAGRILEPGAAPIQD